MLPSTPRRLTTLLLLLVALYGCGFRLAGTAPLPESLDRIQLETTNFDNRQQNELLQRLRRAGADVSLEPGSDRTRLRVTLQALPDQRLITSASSGKSVNRLTRRLEYRLQDPDGIMLTEPGSLTLENEYTLDDDNLLSASDEKQSVVEDLEKNLYEQLIRQLQRI